MLHMNSSFAVLPPSWASSNGKGVTIKMSTLHHCVNKGMVVLAMLRCVVKLVWTNSEWHLCSCVWMNAHESSKMFHLFSCSRPKWWTFYSLYNDVFFRTSCGLNHKACGFQAGSFHLPASMQSSSLSFHSFKFTSSVLSDNHWYR